MTETNLDSSYKLLLHMTDQQAADILKRLILQPRTARANGKSFTHAATEIALEKAIKALEEREHSQK